MEIPSNINLEIIEYCKINDISDVDGFTMKMIKQGLTIEKYGSRPSQPQQEPKVIEKIIEVPVEKIVKISDDTKLDDLIKENETLLGEIEELNRQLKEIKHKKDIYGE